MFMPENRVPLSFYSYYMYSYFILVFPHEVHVLCIMSSFSCLGLTYVHLNRCRGIEVFFSEDVTLTIENHSEILSQCAPSFGKYLLGLPSILF